MGTDDASWLPFPGAPVLPARTLHAADFFGPTPPDLADMPITSGIISGQRKAAGCCVTINGVPLPLAPSLALRRHSPTGFEWGYEGSGPAQLALALLLAITADTATALRLYQDFKCAYVATIQSDLWQLDVDDVRGWVLRQTVDNHGY